MISEMRKDLRDVYGYGLLLDIVKFKEELKDERRSEIAKNIEPVRHFLPD